MLGVNASTISRALKGENGVSADLRQKILQLAEEHGYRPNPFAMSLRYDTTRTIGVIVPDLAFSHFAHIVKHIEAEARKAGYMCIISDSNEHYETEVACVELLENLHVDGIIMCLSQETVDLSHGARNIAFLGGPNHMKQTADRKHGYLEALRERGLPIRKELVRCTYATFNSGLSDTIDLLNLPKPPDAILATYGLLVGSAFQAILSRGLRIPEDIAIAGYMSDWVSEMNRPRVTFIKQNLREIGRQAFRMLYAQMEGGTSVQQLIINAHLEIRDSTRKI